MTQYIDDNNSEIIVKAKKIISDILLFYWVGFICLFCFTVGVVGVFYSLIHNNASLLPSIFTAIGFFFGGLIWFYDLKKDIFKKNIYLTKNNLIISYDNKIVKSIPINKIKDIKSLYYKCGHSYEIFYDNKSEIIHYFNLNEMALYLNIRKFKKHIPYSIIFLLINLLVFSIIPLAIITHFFK